MRNLICRIMSHDVTESRTDYKRQAFLCVRCWQWVSYLNNQLVEAPPEGAKWVGAGRREVR